MRRLFDNAPILLFLTMLFWAGNSVLARAIRHDIPPITLAFGRWTIAFVLLLIFFGPRLKADFPVLRASWPITLFLGVTGVSLYNTFYYIGATHAPALNLFAIQASMPALVLVIGAMLFREPTPPRIQIGVAVSMLGALVIAAQGSWANLASFRFGVGETWAFAAMVSYAFYTAALRHRPKVDPMSFLIVTFGIGAVSLAPFWLQERAAGAHVVWSLRSIAAFAYVGVFPSILAYLCFNRAVALAGSAAASPYFHLTPAIGIVLAMLLLDERPHVYHAVGVALIAAGLVLATRRPRPSAAS